MRLTIVFSCLLGKRSDRGESAAAALRYGKMNFESGDGISLAY
jgi:hypothetical protein